MLIRKVKGEGILFLFVMLALFAFSTANAESKIVLPSSLEEIEDEAFFGIHADSVVLPDHLLRIGPRAFAEGAIGTVFFPVTIEYIDDSAFENTYVNTVFATENSYAYNWAVRKGLIDICPVSANITSIAGDENEGHFHDYGLGHIFSGTITSTVPIHTITSAVVYRGGERNGQTAYDCSKAVLRFPEGITSTSIRHTDLDIYMKFGSMPCAPLRMYLYAELMDGRTYTIYEYDFEIIRRCKSITLNHTEKKLKYGTSFWLSPTVSPSNATYQNSFYFESSNPAVASVDALGHVQARRISGTTIITAYSGDRFASTSCMVTVTESLLDTPQIVDYIAEPAYYDSWGSWILMNVTEVEDAAWYELYRATAPEGPYSDMGYTDGYGSEYVENPFSSGLVVIDSECEDDTTYYYRIRARSSSGLYSDYSKVFKANSASIIWQDIYDEEVVIEISDDLVVSDYIDDESGRYLELSGIVLANHPLSNITASIYSNWGTLMTQISVNPASETYPLSDLRLDTLSYENGLYELVIKATANDETIVLAKKVFFVQRTICYMDTTEQLQRDIAVYAMNHSSSIFNPEDEVDEYFYRMGVTDVIAMALSDYTGIAISWIEDKITGSEYNSYMVKKFEAQIIKILNQMNQEGKIEEIQLSTSETSLINTLKNLTKNGTKVWIDDVQNVFDQYGGSGIDWDELGTLLIIRDGCEEISDLFDEIKVGEEFINLICEIFTDHSKDLKVLEIINQTYNANGNPSFALAQDKIRLSYKTQFGSSLRMIFNKIQKELEEKALKEITKAVLTTSAGHLYSLMDTVIQVSLELFGIKEAGKNRIDFVTQYTTLSTLRLMYGNVQSQIVINYANGILPTESQIHQLQVTFQSAKQALIQLYNTMEKLDEANAGIYNGSAERVERLMMPGLDRMGYSEYYFMQRDIMDQKDE